MEEVEIGVGTEELMVGNTKGVKDRIDLPMVGYKRHWRGTKLSASPGFPMIGYIDSNEDFPEDTIITREMTKTPMSLTKMLKIVPEKQSDRRLWEMRFLGTRDRLQGCTN